MKKLILAVGLAASFIALPVIAGTPCDDVKAGIAKKLDDKGVKNYTLEAVASADVKDQKVVGSCDAGAKKIVYARGAAKAEAKVEAKHEAKAAEPAPAAAPAMKGPAMTKPGAQK